MKAGSNISATPHSDAIRATIEELLRRQGVGDQIGWDELEKACDVPRTGLYGAVRSACKRIEPLGFKFITRIGIGVERIDDNGIAAEVLPAQMRRGQRLGRRIRKIVATVNLQKVEPERRLSVVGAGTVGAWLEAAAKPKAVKQLGAQKDIALIGKESIEKMQGNKE